mgnify:CR=1 FL=1
MKLLSVIVPCYNSQDYLHKCIDSLVVGGDLMDIIIINDGSEDNTGKIADEYAAKYPFIRVIHQENGGHGEGINQGLKVAKGIYTKVVDSDDILSEDLPTFLDQLAKWEEEGGVDLAITNYYYVHNNSKHNKSISYDNALPEETIFGWDDVKRFYPHQHFTIHSTTYRTEVMRKSTTPLPKHTSYEDNFMVYRSLNDVERMGYLNVDLYHYTIGRDEQSMQESTMIKKYTHLLLVAQLCFTCYHLDDIKSTKLRKYLEHNLFILIGGGVIYGNMNGSLQAKKDIDEFWNACLDYDKKYAKKLQRTPLCVSLLPFTISRPICMIFKWVSHMVVPFN